MHRDATAVSVEDLEPHPFNQTVYDQPDEGLVDSIREFGLENPIIVNAEGEILSGARRWAAFQSLERSEIPAQQVDLEDEDAEKRVILVQNAYRGYKNPRVRMREANAYYRLLQEGEATKEDLRQAAEQQDTKPQDDRPFCLAAAAAGLNKTDYNGLRRL